MLLTIHIIPIVHSVFCWCCLCFDLNLTIPSAKAVIYSVVKYLFVWLWFCLLPSLPLSRPGHYHWGWDSGRWQQENYALWHWYDEVYLLWLLPGSLSCWCHCWGKNKCIKQGVRHSIHHQNPNVYKKLHIVWVQLGIIFWHWHFNINHFLNSSLRVQTLSSPQRHTRSCCTIKRSCLTMEIDGRLR